MQLCFLDPRYHSHFAFLRVCLVSLLITAIECLTSLALLSILSFLSFLVLPVSVGSNSLMDVQLLVAGQSTHLWPHFGTCDIFH